MQLPFHFGGILASPLVQLAGVVDWFTTPADLFLDCQGGTQMAYSMVNVLERRRELHSPWGLHDHSGMESDVRAEQVVDL